MEQAVRGGVLNGALAEVAGELKREKLLTAQQVAPLVGVKHRKTVERYVRKKGLPCVRMGRTLRFHPGDVSRWVAQRKEG